MKKFRGLSLVELLISMALGLLLTGMVFMVFLSTRSSSTGVNAVSTLSDDGRFALYFLRNAIRSAGYIGCNTSTRVVNGLSLGTNPMPFNFAEPIHGYDFNNTGISQSYALPSTLPNPNSKFPDTVSADWTPSLDAVFNGNPGVVAGSDVIVVRSGTSVAPVNVTSIVDGATNFTVNSTTNYAAGQLVVISDCAKSTTFNISSISAGNVINHDVTAATAGSNAAQTFTLNFRAGSMMSQVDTQVFYIGVGQDGNGALMSLDLNAGTNFAIQELVPDVENMQILYGFDSNNTQSASQYYTAAGISNGGLSFNNVVSVKIAILVASPPNSLPALPAAAPVFNMLGTLITAQRDTRMRQVFEATIALRNALP